MPEMAKVARERSRTATQSSSPAPAPALVPRRTPLATHPDQLRGLSPASRAAAVRNLQARVGNQAVARLLGEGSPPPAATHPDHSGQLVQRGEDRSSSGEQDANRGRTFVRSQAEPSTHAAQAVPASVADTVRSPGQPLQPAVRQEMASRLGADFAAVRTHTDAAASRSAEGIGAQAYTVGSHIVFRAGEYQPSTPAGRQLLAHELTHVTQHRHGPVTGTDHGSGLTISNPADRFEREAEATASQVMSGLLEASNTAHEAQRAGRQVQRQVGKKQRKKWRGNRKSQSRARLNIRSATSLQEPGTISGIAAWPDRPPSNIGSGQRQHLTAYVAFEQMMLSNVRSRTPTQAATQLINLANEFMQLPYMQPPNQSNTHIHQSLQKIITELMAATNMPEDEAAKVVGEQIGELLAERNRIPSTAIGKKGTRGHGEAKPSGELEAETGLRTRKPGMHTDVNAQQAVRNMWFLFDYNPSDPGTPADPTKLMEIQRRVLTHVWTMRQAFPQVFAFLSERPNYWLLPYLRNHQGIFTALRRVAPANLLTIETWVHEELPEPG